MAANAKEMETKVSMFLNGISLVQHGEGNKCTCLVTSSTILKAAS
jgi:hypothetical protein